MIVQCDKCHQQFDVPDDVLQPNGRNLKCANCESLFFQEAPKPVSNAVKSADPPSTALDEPEQESLDALMTETEEDPFDSAGMEADAFSLASELEDEESLPSATPGSSPMTEEMTQDPEHLEELLGDMQEEHPEDLPLIEEEEEEWATPSDDLGEIDLDGDPELRVLEEMEEDSAGLEEDDEAATQLMAQAGRLEAGGHSEQESDDEAVTQLAMGRPVREPHLEEEEEEDDLIAAAKEHYLPLEEGELLPEEGGGPWSSEEEPWPGEEDTRVVSPDDLGKLDKIEPRFDLPAQAKPGGVALSKEPRAVEEMPARATMAKPATGGMTRKKAARPASGGGMSPLAKPLWAAAGALLLLMLFLLSRTAWWEYAWFNWRSPYQLSSIASSWRQQSFGLMLLVQGEVTNNGSTPFPPWVQISLLDEKNNTLLTTQVVPGRVVDQKILDGSGEQALQAMIRLQGQERTPGESAWTGKRVPFQAIFVNPPGEASRFQVDFSGTAPVSAPQKPQKDGASHL
ncbi:MAG: zinc-ribbon domain-containing protein [Magnetococcales bacterium]|nr:zinc-ribbon domain-containing protein [Magnetococcales bacterium]